MAANRVENLVQELGEINLQGPQPNDSDLDSDSTATMARIDLLEHENANMRQLLSSLHQILGEMRRSAHLQLYGSPEAENVLGDHGPTGDLHEQINSLPITWIYDKIKDEIEKSLATISDFLRAIAA